MDKNYNKPYSEWSLIELLDEAIGLSESVCSEFCGFGCKCNEYQAAVNKAIKDLTDGI